ncbi:MAG: class I SAM-dependent methyltransferase [Atopobiaceae bacterium]|nr:class I SAM-dependent methyltransferase [Atopobiaceae bacterium]
MAERIISIPNPLDGRSVDVRVRDAGAEQFAARLRKVFRERRKWAKREGVSCYRVYDADLPDFSLAVDLYQGAGSSEGESFCVVAEYQAPKSIDAGRAADRFADALAITPVVLGVPVENVFAKQRRAGESTAGQYTHEQGSTRIAYTSEGGRLFELDFGSYLDTGLFLDHRTTRLMVGRMAQGRSFLNLFAYTGAASVHAAAGGATRTTTVDMSNTYLARARRNMEMNGFGGSEHSYVCADCLSWLEAQAADPNRARYDLVFVDPPTFSNSKSMGERTWDVQRDHVELLTNVSRLLEPGGTIVFSNNLRSFRIDTEGLAGAGIEARDITAQTIPHDFERNPRIHCCFICTLA